VERLKGERWAAFRDRRGDWGRDLALAVARRSTGLTLRELGARAGGLDYAAVSEAIRYFESRRVRREDARDALKRVSEYLNL